MNNLVQCLLNTTIHCLICITVSCRLFSIMQQLKQTILTCGIGLTYTRDFFLLILRLQKMLFWRRNL
uniref:AP-2 complex subunit beta-1, putative n=1 Tax=Arundo donax TaxID=35708 RepID=A0A0A9C1P1_ARUDO